MIDSQPPKLNRSFARRVGKTLSPLRKNLLAKELPYYLLEIENLGQLAEKYQSISLEIGFGMGDHLIDQAIKYPEILHIGIEPYLNGVAKALSLVLQYKLSNVLIYPDDVDLILGHLPLSYLDKIYILFPDPWPKLKQQKKRLVNEIRIKQLLSKLKPGGLFIFGSDVENYAQSVNDLCKTIPHLYKIESGAWQSSYQPTKYHLKAQKKGIQVHFLCFSYEQQQ